MEDKSSKLASSGVPIMPVLRHWLAYRDRWKDAPKVITPRDDDDLAEWRQLGYRIEGPFVREIKHVVAIEAPPVSDGVPAKVWKIAFDALNVIGEQ